jgi:hypothetical protein
METILLGSVMLAMGWLVLWCCIDHSRPSKTWWPFDFRLIPATVAKGQEGKRAPKQKSPKRGRQWRPSGS